VRASGPDPVTGGGKFQQALGILVGDFAEVSGAERERVKEAAADFSRAERVVDGEEDAVGAEDLEGAEERRESEVSAGGDVEVLVEDFRDGAAEFLTAAGEDSVGAGERVGEVFAHVADDDLQAREAFEEVGGDEAECVHAGLDVPAPACGREHKAEVCRGLRVVR
jgi:hypothetical protein